MTAQNMGKKILSDAGYDVVAVSNGAAAVKKIAEQKPDIIILDVYMPGYSGLEVCEKVRGSLDTLKTPVLLTVGKLEPLVKPEDANRVKADGVIIKPFEASDLLAIVKKFEERIGSAPPPPMVTQKIVAEPEYEEEPVAHESALDHHATGAKTNMQPMVEVPDHMASSAAFGDMLGGSSEAANSTAHFAVNTPAATFETSVIVPAPPVPTAEHEAPELVIEEERPEPMVAAPMPPSIDDVSLPTFVAMPVEAAPAPIEVEHTPLEVEHTPLVVARPEPAVERAHPNFIPVFKEPEAPRDAEFAFMPTSTPAVEDLEIPREPALQETAEETTRSTRADQLEPGLMSTIGQQVEAFQTEVMEAGSPSVPEIEASPAPEASHPAPVPAPAAEISPQAADADFEARVAAAMSAYSKAAETETMPPPVAEPAPVVTEQTHVVSMPDVSQVRSPEPVVDQAYAASAPIPSFEYQPPVKTAEPPHVAGSTTAGGNAYENSSSPIEAPAPPPVSAKVDPAAVAASVEAAIPEAAASVAAATDGDHHTIAQAVHRVMERLKPELVEEIMKELKSKK